MGGEGGRGDKEWECSLANVVQVEELMGGEGGRRDK